MQRDSTKEDINQADDSNPNKNISIQRIRKQSQSTILSAEVFQSKKKAVNRRYIIEPTPTRLK
jgi:hypothetical protein